MWTAGVLDRRVVMCMRVNEAKYFRSCRDVCDMAANRTTIATIDYVCRIIAYDTLALRLRLMQPVRNAHIL